MNEGGKPAANILDFSKLRKKQQKKKKREDKNKVKKVTVSNLLRGIGSINSAGAATSGSPYGSPLRSGRGEGSSSFGSGGSATGTASGLPRWASSTTRPGIPAML